VLPLPLRQLLLKQEQSPQACLRALCLPHPGHGACTAAGTASHSHSHSHSYRDSYTHSHRDGLLTHPTPAQRPPMPSPCPRDVSHSPRATPTHLANAGSKGPQNSAPGATTGDPPAVASAGRGELLRRRGPAQEQEEGEVGRTDP